MPYSFHPGGRLLPIRPMPIYFQRAHPLHIPGPSVHLDPRVHHTAMPHLMFTASLERHYREPTFPGPLGDPRKVYVLHDMRSRAGFHPDKRRSHSLRERTASKLEPIVDFSDVNDSFQQGVEEEDSTSIEEELARIQEISEDGDGDQFDRLQTVHGDRSQSESQDHDGYVPLETIRRVKEQARQQAVRMREREMRENVETIDLSKIAVDSHYDRPRRNVTARSSHRNGEQRGPIHNPGTAARTNTAAPGYGREWIPGESNIPDGIVAGSHSNVAGRRLVSIPDSAFYATISESASVPDMDGLSSTGPPEPPERPRSRNQYRHNNPRYDRPRQTIRRMDSSVQPIIQSAKHQNELTSCKRIIMVFLLIICVLFLMTVTGVILTFIFSKYFFHKYALHRNVFYLSLAWSFSWSKQLVTILTESPPPPS